MAFEPTLVARVDMDPVPRVEITFTSVPVGTVTANVVRVVGGVSSRVRGGVGLFASGGFALVDTEAPFLVDVEYRAEAFDAAGLSLGFTDGSETSLDFSGTVFHNPLSPSTGLLVDPLPSFAGSLSAPYSGELVQPLGSTRPVYVGFGRTGFRGVSLDVATDTDEQALQMSGLFGTRDQPLPPILCVRTDPKWRLPLPFFAVVQEPREERFNVEFGGQIRYWRMVGDEARPPAVALSAAGLTYFDMEATYATYDDIEAAYLTYLDAESDFTLAGVAS